jgi:hypothetical protein
MFRSHALRGNARIEALPRSSLYLRGRASQCSFKKERGNEEFSLIFQLFYRAIRVWKIDLKS